ncbi:hypothetical protein [Alishewanella longhuensis]
MKSFFAPLWQKPLYTCACVLAMLLVFIVDYQQRLAAPIPRLAPQQGALDLAKAPPGMPLSSPYITQWLAALATESTATTVEDPATTEPTVQPLPGGTNLGDLQLVVRATLINAKGERYAIAQLQHPGEAPQWLNLHEQQQVGDYLLTAITVQQLTFLPISLSTNAATNLESEPAAYAITVPVFTLSSQLAQGVNNATD